MDWKRKYLSGLAELCCDCKEDPALSMTQRKIFAETYLLAKRYSSLPNAGDVKNVDAVIEKLCGACQSVFSQDCAGRSDWEQPCSLLRDHLCRQMRKPLPRCLSQELC